MHFLLALEVHLVRLRVLLRLIVELEEFLPHGIDWNLGLVLFSLNFGDQFEHVLLHGQWEGVSIFALAWLKQIFHLLLLINLHFLKALSGTASHGSGCCRGAICCDIFSFCIIHDNFFIIVFRSGCEFDSLL